MRINYRLFQWPLLDELAYIRKCLDVHGERIEDVNPSSAFSRPCCDDAETLRFLIERGMRGTVSDIQHTFHLRYSKAFPRSGQLKTGQLLAVELILKTHNLPKTTDWIAGVVNVHVRDHVSLCIQKAEQRCLDACVALIATLKDRTVLPKDLRVVLAHELWSTRWDFSKWLTESRST